jgi:hypothetical protein
VTEAQVRDFDRLVDRLDRDVEAGRIEPIDRAFTLHTNGLDAHDDAAAWAVSVYLDERP